VTFDLVLDPLRYPFMRTGLLEVVLLGVACGVIGPFVVQRQLTFFGHALSHTIFPALVLAAVLRVNPLLAASLGAALTVGLVFRLQRRSNVGQDSAVGTILVGLFALGVVLVGWFRVRSPDVGAAVVGNVLGIGPSDLVVSGALVVLLLVGMGLVYRPLVLVSFDRLGARALALPVPPLDLMLLAAIAATAVVSVKVVGVILTVAMLVTPAAAARLWSAHLPRIMLLTGLFGALAGTVGLYAVYYVAIAPAAVVVIVLGALFSVSVTVAPRGPVRRGLRHAIRQPTGYTLPAWRRLDWS
jgi:ABC-type Mn2+/Zn2+ transport system permease subunit